MADERLKITHRILGYLVENPNAQDTLEGIVEWWLLDRFTRSNAARVKDALEELVTADLILERKGKELRTYYKINPGKLKEISALIASTSRPRGSNS